MAYKLSDLLRDVYTELGQLTVATATGGSSNTLEDAGLAGEHQDDEWKDGALLMLECGQGGPEGEFERISGFEASSGTFTLANDLSAAIASADRYGLVSAYYPLETTIELVNAGLRALGDIPLVAEQTLASIGGQSAYAASLEWAAQRPRRIDFKAIPGLSGVDPWRTVHDWEYVPSTPGSPGLILFKEALPAGREVRVWYQGSHPRLAAHDDEIAQSISPELAVAACVERALRWQHARMGGGDQRLAASWQRAQANLNEAKVLFPAWKPARASRLRLAGGGR